MEDTASDEMIPDDVVLQLPKEPNEEDMAAEMETMEEAVMAAETSINEEEETAEPQQEKEREEEKQRDN